MRESHEFHGCVVSVWKLCVHKKFPEALGWNWKGKCKRVEVKEVAEERNNLSLRKRKEEAKAANWNEDALKRREINFQITPPS